LVWQRMGILQSCYRFITALAVNFSGYDQM